MLTDKETNSQATLAYGVIAISCNRETALLINQVSYEWARLGGYIMIKVLQVVATETPFQIYFVYSLMHHQT